MTPWTNVTWDKSVYQQKYLSTKSLLGQMFFSCFIRSCMGNAFMVAYLSLMFPSFLIKSASNQVHTFLNVVQLCSTVFNIIQHCSKTFNQLCKTLYNFVQICPMLLNFAQHCKTLFNFVRLCSTLRSYA